MNKEQKNNFSVAREKTLDTIKQVLDRYDPMGLLSIGCPSDEYSLEVNLIESTIRDVGVPNIVELSEIISNVFFNQFDELLDETICKKIAIDINSKLSN